jgi:hypothetical protein
MALWSCFFQVFRQIKPKMSLFVRAQKSRKNKLRIQADADSLSVVI